MTEPEQAATPDSGTRPSIRRLMPLVVLIAAVALAFYFDFDRYLTFESLRDHREMLIDWYNGHQVVTVLVYIAVYSSVTALSLPGATLMTLVGGFLFGTIVACVVVVFAATLGALAVFLIARYALADFFHAKMGDAGQRMEDGFRRNALSYLLFLRLVPLFPFWLVNLVPAFLGVPARTFIIGTFVGIIPGSAVYCSVGNGLGAVFESGGTPDLGIIFEPEVLVPLLALAALSLVPIVYKRVKRA